MKKILQILLMSSLFIACLAGSAMATVVLEPSTIVVPPNNIGYINVTIKDMPTQYYNMYFNVSEDHNAFTAQIIDSDPSDKIDTSVIDMSTPSFFKNLLLNKTDTVKAKIKISRNDLTDEGVVTLTYNGVKYPIFISADSTIVQAPEFPTVALPVAAVLGLLFVFGRKKGDL